jgi:bifunctional non-homologous end joining protein LigD
VPPARLPLVKTPMAATQVARPFHHPGWVYEEKVDGWRVLAYKDAAGVRLVSRKARDLSRRFPEIVAAVAELEVPTLLLDGEIAVSIASCSRGSSGCAAGRRMRRPPRRH